MFLYLFSCKYIFLYLWCTNLYWVGPNSLFLRVLNNLYLTSEFDNFRLSQVFIHSDLRVCAGLLLQAHFAQLQSPAGVAPAMASSLPAFHPGAPRLAPPQLFYGQGAHGMIPPGPAGYGFQQQLLPGIRPGVGQMTNFIMPYNLQRQGQPGQRMGTRRGGAQQLQQQQVFSLLLLFEMPATAELFELIQRNANQSFRYLQNARNGVEPQMIPQGFMGPMIPMPLDASGMPLSPMEAPRPQAVPITTLASALASANPEHRRMVCQHSFLMFLIFWVILMLGEQLFPLVERIEHDHAGKVTGMLLEMDQTEVLHLIESPDALKAKVAEAIEVLRLAQAAAAAADSADHLGSLNVGVDGNPCEEANAP
ncbi:Polyadenylate-binding protein 5 [Nymphaea thermarum]|nr:Polyadenylate-binding protein 5 [Nymphaea thermarum]